MSPPRTTAPDRGFTLLELLVTLAIISVVLTSTASISSHALDMQRSARSRLESQRAASAVFGQLRADLSRRVAREDAPVRVDKRAGNDSLTLLTSRAGFPVASEVADRQVSVASFRVEDHRLQRAAAGFRFGVDGASRPSLADGTLALVEFPADGPEPPSDDAFQPLAPGVLRLELSFLVDDPEVPVRADPPADRSRIDALIVTVVTLDPARRRMLDASHLERLAARFDDAEDGEPPAERWTEVAAMLPRTLESFPSEPLRHVRVHQAVIPLHTTR